MQCVALLLFLQHARRRLAVFLFVEGIAKTLAGLGHLLLDFLVVLRNLVLDQHVGAITLLRVTVVNQRVVKRVHMSAGLPNRRVHEHTRVDAHDVLMHQHHRLPPVLLDIILQFHTVLAVVIHCAQTIIDFARREDKPVLLTVRNHLLENVFLCHF